jgi:hypothetical protein
MRFLKHCRTVNPKPAAPAGKLAQTIMIESNKDTETIAPALGDQIDEYKGYAIKTRTSKKGNPMACYTREDGRVFCEQVSEIHLLKKLIDSHIEGAKYDRLWNALSTLISEHTAEKVIDCILNLADAKGRQSIKSHDSKTYFVDRELLIKANKNEVLDLAKHTSSFRDFEDFEAAFNKAVNQFRKSQSKRAKRLSAEVSFIFDALDQNWEHSCEQEAGDFGNRRYYWHGDKGRFLENYRENPCSGIQELEEGFNAEFSTEVINGQPESRESETAATSE